MRPTQLGEAVAERRLQLVIAGKTPREVVVRMGRPVPMDPGGTLADDCWCPLQVVVEGRAGPVRVIAGVDAVQALELAHRAADIDLEMLARADGCAIEWRGGGQYPHAASSTGDT